MSSVRFETERVLGRGGMATVYLARDHQLERRVALKVLAQHLADDPEYQARFLREARAAARLAHPNIVQVFDVLEDERGLFIVMEYVDGETLAEKLARQGRLSPHETVAVAIQLCAGLEEVHAAGFVHRDVTPRNVLVRRDGVAKLSDFGIARTVDGTGVTELGSIMGTVAYLAPEQARGEPVTAAADLYSLGVVLYQLLTGRRPFEAATLPALLLLREHGALAPPREFTRNVPQALEDAVMRCLAGAPEQRPVSAAELARELAASLPEAPTQALPEPTGVRVTEVLAASQSTRPLGRVRSNWGRWPRRPVRQRRSAGVAAVLVLPAALVTSFVFASGRPDDAAVPGQNPPPAEQASPRAESNSEESAEEAETEALVAEQGPACADLEELRHALDDQKKAIQEQKRDTKDKAQRDALDEHKRAIDDQKREIDGELKACR